MSKRGPCDHEWFCESHTNTEYSRGMKCEKCFAREHWTEARFFEWRTEKLAKTPLLQQWDLPAMVADEKEVEAWFQGSQAQ